MAVTGVYFTTGESYLVVGPSVYGLFGCLALLLFTLLYGLRYAAHGAPGDPALHAPGPPEERGKGQGRPKVNSFLL